MLRYIGNGAFIPDLKGELVPARDLTDDEVKHFGAEKLIASGLYEFKIEKSKGTSTKAITQSVIIGNEKE